MILADRVAQCREPFAVKHRTGRVLTLNNTADCADLIVKCPIRYVLADDLIGLCVDLAYSKGARVVACADLLHMPATTLWVEWCNEPWRRALQRNSFQQLEGHASWAGRRGAFIRASLDGRRGTIRTFWTTGENDPGVLASSVEADFDFDTAPDEPLDSPDRRPTLAGIRVRDENAGGDDILARCFRFRYESSWSNYYGRMGLSEMQTAALWRRTLGTIALDVPVLMAFALLLSTRSGLPRRTSCLARLNRARSRSNKHPLLEHIEVRAPILPQYVAQSLGEHHGVRRRPRLHHVRGHLVRRGNQLFWRVPHLRGSARAGAVRTRTVVWTFDEPSRPHGVQHGTPGLAAVEAA
jgi:hypothetical protein